MASILALTPAAEDQSLQVTGHIRTIRHQKHRSFAKIGDGSTTEEIQVLLDPVQAKGLATGTSVDVSGLWCPSPGAQQSYELQAKEVRILGSVDSEMYPIQKKYHSPEYLRTIPHLRLRTPSHALLARLRSDCEFHASTFFRKQDFVRAHPPLITSSDCEGAGEVFLVQTRENKAEGSNVEFFQHPKYLTVSSQLHLEALVHEHPQVWALSPTFRAEKSDTPRHLSEFYMLEAEIRCRSLDQVMDVVEDLIRDVVMKVEASRVGQEILSVRVGSDSPRNGEQSLRRDMIIARWRGIRKTCWPRITYSEAVKLLKAAANSQGTAFERPPSWGSGLQLAHERFIAAEVGQGSPVFVTDYPQTIKPFYMLPTNESSSAEDNMSTVACFDLLFPDVCEVVGGSLREHRLDALISSMQRHGLLPNAGTSSPEANALDWYVDLRRYGSIPHGGFGLGFDRLLSYIAGVDSLKDIVPWPRYFGRCDG